MSLQLVIVRFRFSQDCEVHLQVNVFIFERNALTIPTYQ